MAPPPGFGELERPGGLLARLRELRTEAQDLETLLRAVRNGEADLKAYAGYVAKTVGDTAHLIDEIAASGDDETVAEYADNLRRLHNIWEQMAVCPLLANPSGDFEPQEKMRYLNMLAHQCQRLEAEIGFLTIPPRLNSWLRRARPGYYIPFHVVFQDELPDPEARKTLLNFLAWSPTALKGGLVDAASGLIYRYAEDARQRLLSFGLLALAFLAAAGVVIGSAYLPIDGWPLRAEHVYTLLIGWGSIWAGVAVHIGVDIGKQAQADGRSPILSIGDWPLLLNAKIGQVMLKLLMTLVGLYGLTFTTGIANVTPINALLVGYTLDSVVDLFGASIERRAGAQTAVLKRQLEGG
jgi:hypothetical protein